MDVQRITLPTVQDARGYLTYVESGVHLPFDISRVYYLYNVPVGSERGGHAHRRLKQVIFALSGSFRLHLERQGKSQSVWLNNPREGILIDSMVWRIMDTFSQGAVVMVLASLPYEENEYIRSYEEFCKLQAL